MIWILNEERVEYSKGQLLDLVLLLNRICSIFKPIEEEAQEDESLQAALTAQIRKSEYKGTQAKNLSGQKPRLILDLKAEIGILLKAMTTHGISVESAPTSNKQKEQPAVVKQNEKFAGIAKTKSRNRRTNHNFLVEPLT